MVHGVIEAAMGWQEYHSWEFEADERRYGLPDPEWPEDCGGTPGFENFLEAIANPKQPDHAELMEWYDGCYGGAYQPNSIDHTSPSAVSPPSPSAAPPVKPPTQSG